MKPTSFPLRKSRQRLDTQDHSRYSAGMTYVYPVISRRAGGVSVGINLNPNNACNWQCIYCQVPNLLRGGPPPIALDQLERELNALLVDIVDGDFMSKRVDADMRRLVDVAFSGNGKPTSAAEFPEAVAIAIAPTWVQTCVFLSDDELALGDGWDDYLRLLASAGSDLRGVHLYSLARQPMQSEASRLGQLEITQMEVLAAQIRQLGLTVVVSP